jgi:hypothetical protein
VVRPETVALTPSPPDPPAAGHPRRPVLRGRVRRAAFLGALARYWIDAAGIQWIVDQPAPGERWYEGEVCLVLDPERTHVLPDDGS